MVTTAILTKYQPTKIKEILIVLLMASSSLAQDGSITEHTLEHGGLLRSYLLYVPASYDGTTGWPLVISYHGRGVDLTNHMSGTGMNKEADGAQYIVAYPQGLEVATSRGPAPGWNMFGGTLSDNDDMGFSLELINQIKANYLIDPSRVHLAGWSMGAGFAYEVACLQSDQIASFAAVSQQMAKPQIRACSPDRAMSFLQIHGTADPASSFDGSAPFFGPAPETAAFWGTLNNCSPDPTSMEIEDEVTEDNSTVTLFEYTVCDSGSEVLFYQVNDGGHGWPGPGVFDERFDLGNWNRDINASFEILTFFGRNPLPQFGTAVEKSTWGAVKSDY